jgi:hypothetical protein
VIIQEPLRDLLERYNRCMRSWAFAFILFATAAAQAQPLQNPESKSATVPIVLDHNRISIDVDLQLRDGTRERVRAWVDNGDPDLWVSKRVAALLQLTIVCNGQLCGASLPPGGTLPILIGGLKVIVPSTTAINVPGLAMATPNNAVAPGTSAEIKLPSTMLRGYDVLVNFPGHELTIAPPGGLKFNGEKMKAGVNAANGLIQLSGEIQKKKYNLAFDLGSPISFLSPELFDRLAAAHPDWPQMIGGVGPANVSGEDNEITRKLMRIDRLHVGPLFLTNVAVGRYSRDEIEALGKRTGAAPDGVLGTDILMNYRVGIDFAHSLLYFDIGRLFNFPKFDVVGLILRPESDGRFTIVSTAEYEGKSSVPNAQAGDELVSVNGIPVHGNTLGQVWLMLGGEAGKDRQLTLERDGKPIAVTATVRHFLGEVAERDTSKEKKR